MFKKKRVKESTNKEVDKLFDRQKVLKRTNDEISKKELKEVEERLADKMAEDMYKIVKEEVDLVKCEDGGFNSGHLWRLKNKLRSKTNNTPTAINNQNGALVTGSGGIKIATMEHFKKVLDNRPVKKGLGKYQDERELLCKERIRIAGQNKTPDWSESDVKNVITHLKKKKSRDPHGYSN